MVLNENDEQWSAMDVPNTDLDTQTPTITWLARSFQCPVMDCHYGMTMWYVQCLSENDDQPGQPYTLSRLFVLVPHVNTAVILANKWPRATQNRSLRITTSRPPWFSCMVLVQLRCVLCKGQVTYQLTTWSDQEGISMVNGVCQYKHFPVPGVEVD